MLDVEEGPDVLPQPIPEQVLPGLDEASVFLCGILTSNASSSMWQHHGGERGALLLATRAEV